MRNVNHDDACYQRWAWQNPTKSTRLKHLQDLTADAKLKSKLAALAAMLRVRMRCFCFSLILSLFFYFFFDEHTREVLHHQRVLLSGGGCGLHPNGMLTCPIHMTPQNIKGAHVAATSAHFAVVDARGSRHARRYGLQSHRFFSEIEDPDGLHHGPPVTDESY